jgi:hypothetical protein
MPPKLNWRNTDEIEAKSFRCGYCDNQVGADRGYQLSTTGAQRIFICPYCSSPTYFRHYADDSSQIPSPSFGASVSHIPSLDVEALYNEARACIGVNGYTASVLCSRKLLMNIAVSQGAEVGLRFVEYVNYLEQNHYIPPNSRDWVDHIRKKGNEATHDIQIMQREDAEELITFLEMILRNLYEFPAMLKARLQTQATPAGLVPPASPPPAGRSTNT